MTSKSLLIRSIKFVLATASVRSQHRGNRRAGIVPALPGSIEIVEERCLLSGMPVDIDLPGYSGGLGTGNQNPGTMNPLTSIPVLNSNPGAPVNIYLDFDGHTETQDWPSARTDGQTGPVVTPVFDIDSDFTTFSDEELRLIEEVWYRVSEDYAPFNVNVTTVSPSTFNNFQNILVSIGGDGAWIGSPGGIAWLDSFSNDLVNTCYVFSDNTAAGSAIHAKGIALAASHEVGHTLGLLHHSVYDTAGNQTAEYDSGQPDLGPIMGAPYNSERETWSSAPDSNGPTSIQDDFVVMTRNANQTFRFRTDDRGDTQGAATVLAVTGSSVSVTGIIGTNGDVDMFRFETNSGTVAFDAKGLNLQNIYPTISGVNRGTNLDAVLTLYDVNGAIVSQSNSATSLDAALSATVTAGTYYIAVSGTGQYGAVGQYALTGTVIPLPSTPTMLGPVGILPQPIPLFEWTPGANADHYQLQVDNLTTSQVDYYTRDVTGSSHLAAFQFAQADYQARVRSVAADGSFSAWSDYVTFTVDIPAPTKPVVNRPTGDITDSFPTFGWTGDAAAVTYTLWVNNATTGGRVIYRTQYTGTSYEHFNPLQNGIYRVWVQAFNSLGESSPWSEPVEFTVRVPLPGIPTIIAPVSVSDNSSPRIAWNAAESAANYDLWVDYLTTGTSQFIRQQNIGYTTSYFDTTSLPQGTFRAWVRTANGNNVFSNWSAPYTFTIDILPPSTPNMLTPVGTNGSQIVTTTNPTFTWTAADRAVKYDLWVNNITKGLSQIIRQSNLTETKYVALSNLPEGVYRAWVRGINSANEFGQWSTPFSFTLDEPTPTIPVIVAPVANLAGSVTTTNPTFVWTNALNAPFYEFQLDDQTLKKTNVINVPSIQGTTFTVPSSQTLVEHTYVARVRGRNNSGETSSWSAPFQIRVDIPNPSTPVIIGPTGTSKNTAPTFQWTHSSGSQRYEILVRDLERNENIVLQVKSFILDPTGNVAFYTLPNSQAFRPGTYRFWIRAFNSLDTASSWSSAQTFVISASLDSQILKTVEPTELPSEEFYAVAQSDGQVEREVVEFDAVPAEAAIVTDPFVPTVTKNTMPVAVIEQVMESLSDPASMASSMLSGELLSDSATVPALDGSTTAASMLALAMMPVRRKRRDE